ncbi:hypothetical protein ACQZ4Q_08025 [Agrobacterium vitis]
MNAALRPRGREAKSSGEPGWTWRKSLIFPIVIFACWRLMEMENAPDTMVNQTIAWGWMITIISMAFFFTGFASAQDIAAIIAMRTGTPYAPDRQASDPCPPEPYEPPARPFDARDSGRP